MLRLLLPLVLVLLVGLVLWAALQVPRALRSAGDHHARRLEASRRDRERRAAESAALSLLRTRESSVLTRIGELLRRPAIEDIDQRVVVDLLRLSDELTAARRAHDADPDVGTLNAYSAAVREAERIAEAARVEVARAEIADLDD